MAAAKREPWAAWSLRATVLGVGAAVTLAAAMMAGAPFFMREAPPGDPWFAVWGAGFGAYGTVVSVLQLVDVREGTQAVESSWPKRAIAWLLLGCILVLIPVAAWVGYPAAR